MTDQESWGIAEQLLEKAYAEEDRSGLEAALPLYWQVLKFLRSSRSRHAARVSLEVFAANALSSALHHLGRLPEADSIAIDLVDRFGCDVPASAATPMAVAIARKAEWLCDRSEDQRAIDLLVEAQAKLVPAEAGDAHFVSGTLAFGLGVALTRVGQYERASSAFEEVERASNHCEMLGRDVLAEALRRRAGILHDLAVESGARTFSSEYARLLLRLSREFDDVDDPLVHEWIEWARAGLT